MDILNTIWKNPGPDKGFSWVIAVSAAWINSSVWLFRNFGFIFVAVMEHYKVSRQEAAVPFSVYLFCKYFAGAIGTVFLSWFSPRQIVMVGIIIASIGLFACSFTTSIASLTVCLGVVTGSGIGLCIVPLPIIISQYFDKKAAKAEGIAESGKSLCSFFYLPLTNFLIAHFGLKGYFLVTAGVVSNSLIAALFLRPRTPENFPCLTPPETSQPSTSGGQPQLSPSAEVAKKVLSDISAITALTVSSVLTPPSNTNAQNDQAKSEPEKSHNGTPNSENDNSETSEIQTSSNKGDESQSRASPLRHRNNTATGEVQSVSPSSSVQSTSQPAISVEVGQSGNISSGNTPTADVSFQRNRRFNFAKIKTIGNDVKKMGKDVKKVGKDVKQLCIHRNYMMILATDAIHELLTSILWLVLVDYIQSLGLSQNVASIIAPIFSGVEIVSYHLFDDLIERKILRRETVLCASFFFVGVCYFLMTLKVSTAYFISICVIYAVFSGCIMMCIPASYKKQLQKEQVKTSAGFSNSMKGCVMTVQNQMGTFHGVEGGYVYLWYLQGSVACVLSVCWLGILIRDKYIHRCGYRAT